MSLSKFITHFFYRHFSSVACTTSAIPPLSSLHKEIVGVSGVEPEYYCKRKM
jgi:hypothetical protein